MRQFIFAVLIAACLAGAVIVEPDSPMDENPVLQKRGQPSSSVDGVPRSSVVGSINESNVVEIFGEITTQMLILFTVRNDCPDCSDAAAALDAAIEGPLSDVPDLHFYSIDCAENPVICRVFGQTELPGFHFLHANGAAAELSGPQTRDSEAIATWVRHMRGPALVTVTTKEEASAAAGDAPVFFVLYKPCDAVRSIVYRFAGPFKGRVPFMVTSDESVVADYGVAELENQLLVVKQGEVHVLSAESDKDAAPDETAIARFIYAHHTPELTELTANTFRNLAGLPDRVMAVALYVGELDPGLRAALRGVCSRDSLSAASSATAPLPRFSCAYLDAAAWPDFLRVYGIELEDVAAGTVLAVKPATSQYWIQHASEVVHGWGAGLPAWLDDVASGAIDNEAHKIDLMSGASFAERVAAKLRLVWLYLRLSAREKPALVISIVTITVVAIGTAVFLFVRARKHTRETDELIRQLAQEASQRGAASTEGQEEGAEAAEQNAEEPPAADSAEYLK